MPKVGPTGMAGPTFLSLLAAVPRGQLGISG